MTVCQVHLAVSALVQSWWLNNSAAERLAAQAATKIEWYQRRSAAARASHRKATIHKLHASGIRLTEIKRCKWDTS